MNYFSLMYYDHVHYKVTFFVDKSPILHQSNNVFVTAVQKDTNIEPNLNIKDAEIEKLNSSSSDRVNSISQGELHFENSQSDACHLGTKFNLSECETFLAKNNVFLL